MSRFKLRRGLPTFICFALFMALFTMRKHTHSQQMHTLSSPTVFAVMSSTLKRINYGFYYSKWTNELRMVFRSSGCHTKNQKRIGLAITQWLHVVFFWFIFRSNGNFGWVIQWLYRFHQSISNRRLSLTEISAIYSMLIEKNGNFTCTLGRRGKIWLVIMR